MEYKFEFCEFLSVIDENNYLFKMGKRGWILSAVVKQDGRKPEYYWRRNWICKLIYGN